MLGWKEYLLAQKGRRAADSKVDARRHIAVEPDEDLVPGVLLTHGFFPWGKGKGRGLDVQLLGKGPRLGQFRLHPPDLFRLLSCEEPKAFAMLPANYLALPE